MRLVIMVGTILAAGIGLSLGLLLPLSATSVAVLAVVMAAFGMLASAFAASGILWRVRRLSIRQVHVFSVSARNLATERILWGMGLSEAQVVWSQMSPGIGEEALHRIVSGYLCMPRVFVCIDETLYWRICHCNGMPHVPLGLMIQCCRAERDSVPGLNPGVAVTNLACNGTAPMWVHLPHCVEECTS